MSNFFIVSESKEKNTKKDKTTSLKQVFWRKRKKLQLAALANNNHKKLLQAKADLCCL